jgi:hypothetical protein
MQRYMMAIYACSRSTTSNRASPISGMIIVVQLT